MDCFAISGFARVDMIADYTLRVEFDVSLGQDHRRGADATGGTL